MPPSSNRCASSKPALGTRLAERAGRGIQLTDQGAILAEQLTRSFGQIAEAGRSVGCSHAGAPDPRDHDAGLRSELVLAAHAALQGRPPRYRADGQSDARVDRPGTRAAAMWRSRFGAGGWPGLECEKHCCPSNFVVVAAPELIAGTWRGRPEDLLGLPWLQELGTSEVERWLTEQGIAMPKPAQVTNLPGYMVLSALRDGQGRRRDGARLRRGGFEGGPVGQALTKAPVALRPPTTSAGGPASSGPRSSHFLRWIRQAATD